MTFGFHLWAVAAVLAVAAMFLLFALVRLRQARRTLEASQEAVKARNQYMGMMAHEMLTPLQTIISSIELIELSGKLHAEDQMLRRLRRSAQQLEAQMNDTVEFARLSAGRLKPTARIFQPDLMMQIIVSEYENAASERGLQLKAVHDPHPCPRVITDPAKLRQIIVNLVSNATKYSSPGDVVCSISVHPDASHLTVAVIDQGPGIEVKPELWEPFVRGTQTKSGSGLGLAVVKLMAQLLGGSATVISHPGEGTAFIIKIPVEIEATTAAPSPDEKPLGRLRVLVVDDDDDIRSNLQAILEALGGLQVDAAADVAGAKALLERNRYDGLLLDLWLPDGSGYEIAETARTDGALNQKTPIVALSAFHEPEPARDGMFVAKFTKPISIASLQSVLQYFK